MNEITQCALTALSQTVIKRMTKECANKVMIITQNSLTCYSQQTRQVAEMTKKDVLRHTCASYQIQFVTFRFETHRACRCRRNWHCLRKTLHGFSIPNFSLVSIWRQSFLHQSLPASFSTLFECSFES